MKKLLVTVLLTSGLVLSGFAKTIAFGTTETINEDTQFSEDLLVLGTLNIENCTVTFANDKKLIVGDTAHNGSWSKLNVKNSKIKMGTTWDSMVTIGPNPGYGQMTLDHSELQCTRMDMSDSTKWPRANLIVTNDSSVVLSGGALALNPYYEARDKGTTQQSKVYIYEGCSLKCVSVQADSGLTPVIFFGGGTLATRRLVASRNVTLALQGINGHPVKIKVTSDGKDPTLNLFSLSGASDILIGATSYSTLSGSDCGLEISGTMDGNLVTSTSSGALRFCQAGGTKILDTVKIKLSADDQLALGGDLSVGANASVDLDGHSQTVGGLTGGGTIKNSGSAATITMDVAADDERVFGAAPSTSGISLVKTGAGTLLAQKGDLVNFTVQGGKVKVADPVATGYPAYRFFVTRPYGTEYGGMTYSELTFYNGEDNVTDPIERIDQIGGYSADLRGMELFDGDNKTYVWWECEYQGNPLGDRGYANVTLPSPRMLSGYTWTSYVGAAPPSVAWCTDPGEWGFYGCYHGGDWIRLGGMGLREYTSPGRGVESVKFPVTYSTVPYVKIGDNVSITGGTLEMDGNASVRVSEGKTFDVSGSEVQFTALSVDCSETTGGTIRGGTIAGTGKLYLSGLGDAKLKNGTRIPLAFSDTAVASNFDKWDIYVDGVLQTKHWATFADGQFVVDGEGMLLLLR